MLPLLLLLLLRACVGCALATLLARRGLRKRSLSSSGAAAAFVVGAVAIAAGYLYGALLLAFYFSGSSLTKYKSATKARLDYEHKQGEGERGAAQVLATAGVASILCLISLAVEMGMLSSPSVQLGPLIVPLPLVTRAQTDAALLLGILASLATAAGDTWASELGMLSTAEPFLLVGCRRVPRGTNGGVSAFGTLASGLGGALIGAVAGTGLAAATALGVAGQAGVVGVLAGMFHDIAGFISSLVSLVVSGRGQSFDFGVAGRDGGMASALLVALCLTLTGCAAGLIGGLMGYESAGRMRSMGS